MPKITKPLLASPIEDLDLIQYPVIVSPKIDGIRCLKINGEVVSRNLKPIPNDYIRKTLKRELPEGADGEIVVGKNFQQIQSAVMKKDGQPLFKFYMFDYVKRNLSRPYSARMVDMENWYRDRDPKKRAHVRLIGHHLVQNKKQLLTREDTFLDRGFEGLMIRSLDGHYKCGRSSVKEGILLKLKRFRDSEAIILGIEELMINGNEATINALGYQERSTHKDNLIPAGTAGTLLCEDIHTGVRFRMGSGMDTEIRDWFWKNRFNIIAHPENYIVKYKFFEIGIKEKPRFPIFLELRDKADMDD